MGIYYWDEVCVCVVSGSGWKRYSHPDLSLAWFCRKRKGDSYTDYGPPPIEIVQARALNKLWYSVLNDFKDHPTPPPMYCAVITHYADTYGPTQEVQVAMDQAWVHRIYHCTDFLLHLNRLFPVIMHPYFLDNPSSLFMGHRRLMGPRRTVDESSHEMKE